MKVKRFGRITKSVAFSATYQKSREMAQTPTNAELAPLITGIGGTHVQKGTCGGPNGQGCGTYVNAPYNDEYVVTYQGYGACEYCPGKQGRECDGSGLQGTQCIIQRTGYNGHPGVCGLVAAAGAQQPILVDVPIYTPESQFASQTQLPVAWSSVTSTVNGTGQGLYTCDPGVYSGISGFLSGTTPSAVASVCGYSQLIGNAPSPVDTWGQWAPGGLCSNYVTTGHPMGVTAASYPLTAALANFQFGFDTSTLSPELQDPANQLLENLLGLCANYPGTCDIVLQQKCATENISQKYCGGVGTDYECLQQLYLSLSSGEATTAQVPIIKNLFNACACHLPATSYPTQDAGNGVAGIECDPLCKIPGTVGLSTPCQQGMCVMNDITINFVNSSGGNINFSEVCPSCATGSGSGSAGCVCMFNDVNITAVNSSIGTATLTQNCSKCMSDGVYVNCLTGAPVTGGGCSADSDCPSGQVCAAGSCTAPPSGGGGNSIITTIKTYFAGLSKVQIAMIAGGVFLVMVVMLWLLFF